MEYQFKLQHLKCSHCADKIEKKLNKLPFIEEAELNFMLKTLKVTTSIKDKNRIRRKVEEAARSIEKEVKVLDEEEGLQGKVVQDKSMQSRLSKYLVMMGCILAIVAFKKQLEGLFVIAYFLISYDIILKAGRNLIRGRVLDENFLMTIATLAAIAIEEYPEAMMVMLFYKVGEYIESRAVNHSRTEITKIMDIRPSFARVIRHLETGYIAQNVPPEEVALGEILEIRSGERVPLDGRVIKGKSLLDCSVLTGEAVPIPVQEGSEVLSGSVNKEGVIFIQVTTLFKESTVSKILRLMQEASSKKSKSEHFITKFARIYTPIVVGIALFLAVVPSLVTGDLSRWINTSIIFLVVSCPCAIVVSVPLGFFAGIGKAAEKKILVKGSNYLERLNQIDTIVLDKTGTITEGNFSISEVIEKAETKDTLLRYAASIEYYSNHPIARAIIREYGKTDLFKMKEVQEVSGKGVVGYLEEGVLVVGNSQLMEQHRIIVEEFKGLGTPIYVAKNGVFLGSIVVRDPIKAQSKEAILKFKEIGIQKIIMLTGDKRNVAEEVAREVGIDEVHAGLLPEHKVDKVEHLLLKHKVAFVGDGINDAPVLKRADIGIAMGGIGQDAAIEASDIVLMTDELTSIYDAIKIAKRTRRIVSQNIGFALGVKGIILVLAILGIGNMWLAVFGDVGVSLLAVLNSIRILYSK